MEDGECMIVAMMPIVAKLGVGNQYILLHNLILFDFQLEVVFIYGNLAIMCEFHGRVNVSTNLIQRTL